jgi:hypothetical protein
MYRRYNRLLFLIFAATAAIVIWGCSQSEDIVAPASTTKFILRPERLPTLPEGMVYELWVKNDNGGQVSLGKFRWDSELYRFYDTAGNRIDSLFSADFDALNYKYLCLSVENYPDSYPDSMGPVMLQDTIVSPEKKPLELVFPVDLWLGQAGYVVQTPSDKNSYENDASGIWFALYAYDSLRFYDTVYAYISHSVRRYTKRPYTLDTIGWDSSQTPPVALVDVHNKDSIAAILDTIASHHGRKVIDSNFIVRLDTLVHTTYAFDFITVNVNVSLTDTVFDTVQFIDTLGNIKDSVFAVPPLSDYIHIITYSSKAKDDTLDNFLFNYEELPDLDKAGSDGGDLRWHYKGWVLSPYLTSASAFGQLAKPSWSKTNIEMFLQPSDGRIITTGSFKSFNAPDDANPYTMNKRVPPFPGEDFLINLPEGVDRIVFADSSNPDSRAGTVFITLEPDNYDNPNANFPLILFVSEELIPSYKDISKIGPQVQDNRMKNCYSTVNNDLIGFPKVHVNLIRE